MISVADLVPGRDYTFGGIKVRITGLKIREDRKVVVFCRRNVTEAEIMFSVPEHFHFGCEEVF